MAARGRPRAARPPGWRVRLRGTTLKGMEAVSWVALLASCVALGALLYLLTRSRAGLGGGKDRALVELEALADEVGGLTVVLSSEGSPRLIGGVAGMVVEIDCENHVSPGLDGLLGLRCDVPDAFAAPNAVLWVGDLDALRTQFGRPRPAGDGDGLFEVYTRADPSASDWWHDPSLHDALASLPGAGLVLFEGQLTVLFDRLDAESLRTAMRIPALVREGVRRVTIH